MPFTAVHSSEDVGRIAWSYFVRLVSIARLYAEIVGVAFACLLSYLLIYAIPNENTRLIVGVALLTAAALHLSRFFFSKDLVGAEIDDRTLAKADLKETIASYAGRLPDWDGMGGTSPNPDAIADALTFVNRLSENAVLPDNVYAPGDGEVLFQWRRPETFVEIGFYGDDTISWYARVPDQKIAYGDDYFDRKRNTEFPQTLQRLLGLIEK